MNKRPFGKRTCNCGCANDVIKTKIRNNKIFWVDYIEGHEYQNKTYQNKVVKRYEHQNKIHRNKVNDKIYGSGYYHEKAWKLFGKKFCEGCGITLDEYIVKYNKRFDMHNTLEPKNYCILEEKAWMCLCVKCHGLIETNNITMSRNYSEVNLYEIDQNFNMFK
jgi:hypothetical protein